MTRVSHTSHLQTMTIITLYTELYEHQNKEETPTGLHREDPGRLTHDM